MAITYSHSSLLGPPIYRLTPITDYNPALTEYPPSPTLSSVQQPGSRHNFTYFISFCIPSDDPTPLNPRHFVSLAANIPAETSPRLSRFVSALQQSLESIEADVDAAEGRAPVQAGTCRSHQRHHEPSGRDPLTPQNSTTESVDGKILRPKGTLARRTFLNSECELPIVNTTL